MGCDSIKESFETGLILIREYIDSVHWKFAKSYSKTAPHEYTVRSWNPDLENEFLFFVKFIRKYGYREKWGSRYYTYLEVDGLKYWTMGDPLEVTIILNRTPVTEIKLDQFL